MQTSPHVIDPRAVQEFLHGQRLAVVGASDDKASFGGTIYRELRAHGYDVVAVNPHATSVAGERCYPSVAAVPDPVDGAIVVVNQAAAVGVVHDCAVAGVPRVWLFKGIGGPGAVSDAAVALCHEHGIEVVAGACPLMFLQPVGWFHRLHRGARHLNGSLERAS